MHPAMADLDTFREEPRAGSTANAPVDVHAAASADDVCWGGKKARYPEDVMRWLAVMAERGWTAPTWPREYGGGGLSAEEAKVLRRRWRSSAAPAAASASG